jgi:hypothetical protein
MRGKKTNELAYGGSVRSKYYYLTRVGVGIVVVLTCSGQRRKLGRSVGLELDFEILRFSSDATQTPALR